MVNVHRNSSPWEFRPTNSFEVNELAEFFVRNYYGILLVDAAKLVDFYRKDSVVTCCWGTENPVSLYKGFKRMGGIEGFIRDVLRCVRYHSANINSVVVQSVKDGSVIIIVSGIFVNGDEKNGFSQMFLLQRDGDKYYIGNSHLVMTKVIKNASHVKQTKDIQGGGDRRYPVRHEYKVKKNKDYNEKQGGRSGKTPISTG